LKSRSEALNDLTHAAFQIDFEDVLKHGITAILMIVEMLIGRVPIVSTFILPAVIYAVCYAIFLWIYWAAADKWVYTVLDWRKPGHLAYYLAVIVLVVVSFWIMCASTHVLWAALRSMSCPARAWYTESDLPCGVRGVHCNGTANWLSTCTPKVCTMQWMQAELCEFAVTLHIHTDC
jgi:hypothetical protein